MERNEVVKALIAILKEIQAEVSDEVEEIDIFTRPIGGMRVFDSLMGAVVTARCFEKFEIQDDGKTVSLFEKKKAGELQALTVGEIADQILTLKARGEGK